MFSTLIIDNDARRAENTRAVLEFLGHSTVLRNVTDDDPPDPALLNGLNGFDLVVIAPIDTEPGLKQAFRAIKSARPEVPVIAMATADTSGALDQETGAGDVALVPVPLRLEDFQKALQQVHIRREDRRLEGKTRNPELFRNLVGSSPAVTAVRKLIHQVAESEATVLLTGESGTGKEVVARKIHYNSRRRHKPFVPVNCGAIPRELLESELFGHEKGAFTGAIGRRRGRFEMAHGGTLFLDEIGDMPMPMQVKLLRVLQERTFERVGSSESLETDVRIVAATHSDLERAIAEGRFREDLYYRLNVFPIEVPPLRARTQDLSLLISDLLHRHAGEKSASVRLTAEALELLQRYPWPGNVRELANLVERLVILYPHGIVDAADLPESYRSLAAAPTVESGSGRQGPDVPTPLALPTEGLDLKLHLSALERELIVQALSDSGGVVSHAARRLRLGRTTLVEKMRKYGIGRGEAREKDLQRLKNNSIS